MTEEGLKSLPSIHAPCSGTIGIIREEMMGTQIELKCDSNPSYYIIIFHIKSQNPFHEGQHFGAGDLLGTHYTSDTYSDIAVRKYGVYTTLHSAFEFMTSECLGQ